MYAIYGNTYHQYTPNVSIYTIHGSNGYVIFQYISPLRYTMSSPGFRCQIFAHIKNTEALILPGCAGHEETIRGDSEVASITSSAGSRLIYIYIIILYYIILYYIILYYIILYYIILYYIYNIMIIITIIITIIIITIIIILIIIHIHI